MDPLNGFSPLFEVKFALSNFELNYIPSLESDIDGNFVNMIESIIKDVTHMATLIPRIHAESNLPDYLVRCTKLICQ